jgi:hypothetical protein
MQGCCAKCGYPASNSRGTCPRCGIRMADDGLTSSTLPHSLHAADDTPDGPSFFRRFALGGITLLGLFHGLKHLTLAGALYLSASSELKPEAIVGLLVAATLAASAAAGTVNRRAELAGFLLGLGAAGSCILSDFAAGQTPPADWLVGVPALLALVGTVGGMAGRLMIPPAPKLPRFGRFDPRLANQRITPPVPLVWWRIAFGALLVAVGTYYAETVRLGLSQILAGHSGSMGSNRMLTWQVSVIFAVLGGVAAGANTRGGIRQGLLAGVAAGAGAIALEATRKAGSAPLLEFWAEQMNVGEIGPMVFAALGGTILVGTAIGGWLGAHLFPPRRKG